MSKKILFIILFIPLLLVTACHEEYVDEREQSDLNIIEIIDNKVFLSFALKFDLAEVTHEANVTFRTPTYEKTDYIYGINSFAYKGNYYLEKIIFDNSPDSQLTIFMKDSFRYCINLIEIIIPDSLQVIEQNTFNTCIRLPEFSALGLITLGDTAFAGCTNLKRVALGDKIESIGSYAFLYCHNDFELTISSPIPPTIGLEIFKGIDNYTIKVPFHLLEVYQSADGWKDYSANIFAIE